MAMLAPVEPLAVPKLMAYRIGCYSEERMPQDYEGLGWVRYDSTFYQQTALSRQQVVASDQLNPVPIYYELFREVNRIKEV